MYRNLAIFFKLKFFNFWQFYLQKVIEFMILFFQNLARVPNFTQKEKRLSRGLQISKATHSILAIVFQIQEPSSLI
jgi:hypothetical protein